MTGAYVLGAFCSLTGPLGTPSSPHMPVRGRECGGGYKVATGGCVETQSTKGWVRLPWEHRWLLEHA